MESGANGPREVLERTERDNKVAITSLDFADTLMLGLLGVYVQRF